MKYLSLFSGVGGFELGIQQAYDDISKSKRSQQGWSKKDSSNPEQSSLATKQPTCIGYSEIDKYAIQVYNKHFNHKNYGDICSIKWEDVPDIDLIVGGFPCQSFSIAGKRKGFEDTRGTLFFEIAKGLKIKQPNFVLLENVKGLISHDKGKTLEVILETLQELGYYVNIEVYNSKDFSVPQNRERIFILCRHIKTLIKDGVEQSLNLSSPIISEFLFQILLNNLVEVTKLQETKSKDWAIGYLLLKEIYQNLELKEENTKDGISTLMEESKSLSEEEVWQNIDTWLQKNLAENFVELNKYTTSTAIRQTIESKTYTYSTMLQSILAVIVQSRNLSKDSWKKTLLNLTLVREHTKKYARINDKKEEVIITETGNTYLVSNLQDFEKHFIIGHLRGTSRPEVFPIGGENQKSCIEAGTITAISGHDILKRAYSTKGLSPVLNTCGGGNTEGKFIIKDKKYGKLDDGALEGEERLQGEERNMLNMRSRKEDRDSSHRRGLEESQTGEPSRGVQELPHEDTQTKKEVQNLRRATEGTPIMQQTLSKMEKREIRIRRLSPVECERLQGFPDDWTKWGDIKNKEGGEIVKISDTQRYKMAGNAVSVPVIKAIVKRLIV